MSRRRYKSVLSGVVLVLMTLSLHGCRADVVPSRYFTIEVVDEQTGRGVPLVELRTVNNICHYTDSGGVVAFYEPGLMNRDVFFQVSSHGYEFAADGFGYRGKTLRTAPGGIARLSIRRKNIAERLYRITGQGIYRDTILVGREAPIKEPLLNGRVLGQDTVMATPYRSRIYWFWGDTNRESYPLGHFATSGATSKLPEKGGLDPSVGIELEYFVDDEGFSKKMVPLGGPGMIWIDGLLTVNDDAGRERLVAHYSRMASLDERLEHGLVVFNEQTQVFERLAKFNSDAAWINLRDVETGAPVHIKSCCVHWNDFRRRYVMILQQLEGTSYLGEIWYAEADAPEGPWLWAQKIVTHDRYTFYNPAYHNFFDQDGGRIIYFEATYTNSFSATDVPTPRYNYNQIMYRLDLSDPQLALPKSQPIPEK